ncbi:MAG TPA: SDR family NAD(P)-dependent oxidoreductase [Alphaproteobacteria bacterium]|nr:SDR family NAD(P)-dependent oxidoreductase [Alphaproteobacteria bacterium]
MPLAMFTGGASWFVREASRNLIGDGWQVALSDIDKEGAEANAKEIGGDNVASVDRLDVTDLDAVRAYADHLAEKHGGIDALINVAGGTNYLKMQRLPLHETDPQTWQRILAPNINGTINCCYAVIPHMIQARRGSIINLSSGMGLKGKPRMALYSFAKGGIVTFTHSLCQELAPYNIRVNAIAPGSAESRWMPELKPAETASTVPPLGTRTSAKDVGDAIHFLISDKARHITGICLDISGGSSLH